MTCIVGLVEGDTVWIGGDSAGCAGYALTVRADQKVFGNGPMLFGFTTSFRMGQLLRYALRIPDHDPRVDVDTYIATTFIDAVRACLKSHGWASKKDESEEGGQFLVGYRGQLFYIGDDYQFGRPLDGYDAVGCGHHLALGALYASGHSSMTSRDRVVTALLAAERSSAGVRAPFCVMSVSASGFVQTSTPEEKA